MKRPTRIEQGAELLDQPIEDASGHRRSLNHLRSVNRWLGGIRGLRRVLDPICGPGARLTLVDVGCGGADVATEMARWASARGVNLTVIGIDRGLDAVRIAAQRAAGDRDVHVLCADALSLPMGDRSADVGLMMLTLHHFDGEERSAVLRELARVARTLVVISDLERTWLNYLGARALAATIWRANRYTRHDGPLSVLRGFSPSELLHDLRDAGLADVTVRRFFFYRLVGTGQPSPNAAAARTLWR